MKLTLFGATGPTGALILEKALAAGHTVTVIVRNPERLRLRDERVRVVCGDVLDPAFDLTPALQGADAVDSSLGAPYTLKPINIYSEGARRILAAMLTTGVQRFVAISSGGTHPGWDRDSPLFFEALLKRIFRKFYADMRLMEELIMASPVDWLILRPPQLVDHPAPGPARERDNAYMVARGAAKISRDALADAVVRHLGPDGKRRVAVALAE
ncbi:MAG: NAD(P)H-binding protein [Nannocystaceae bacterium]